MSILDSETDFQMFSSMSMDRLEDYLAFYRLSLMADDGLSDCGRSIIAQKIRLIEDILEKRKEVK